MMVSTSSSNTKQIPLWSIWLITGMIATISTEAVQDKSISRQINEYLRFLRYFQKSYWKYILYIAFCCCYRMVDRELETFETMALEIKMEEAHKVCINNTKTHELRIKNVKYLIKRTGSIYMESASEECIERSL